MKTLLSGTILFIVLLTSCKKSADTTSEAVPAYKKGLLKRVEFYFVDSSGTNGLMQYCDYDYDEQGRLTQLVQDPETNYYSVTSKAYYHLIYDSTATLPSRVIERDSLYVNPPAANEGLSREYKLYYDGAGRKILDSLKYLNPSIPNTAFKERKFENSDGPKGIFVYSSPLRYRYDAAGTFISIDTWGGTSSDTTASNYRSDYLKVDSSYDEVSPLFLRRLNNCLNSIFGYREPYSMYGRSFSTFGYDPYFSCTKIPKKVTVMDYDRYFTYKVYPTEYLFTYTKDPATNKVDEILSTMRMYNYNYSSLQGETRLKLKLYYY